MGIAPYKYFTFDGVSSRDYDVYLTGQGVFNAPQRAVDLLEIPGRNGNYALDQGRFNNITVTYKAGIVDYSESDFADKVSALRNWLCSKVGYKRLEDDYNPNEYRMAVFANGINVDHEDLRTGEFEITFECKPQRWLTSGETATAVANNGTLSNPTLFESEPLLAVKGYGTIGFNGYEIEIENVPIGDVVIADNVRISSSSNTIVIPNNTFENGDAITINATLSNTIKYQGIPSMSLTVSDSNTDFETSATQHRMTPTLAMLVCDTNVTTSITYGTNATKTDTVTFSQSGSYHGTITLTITYTASTREIAFSTSVSFTPDSASVQLKENLFSGKIPLIQGTSSKSALGNPTYIDCEIGECWMESGGEIISLNGVISLGSDLPKLASGTNTFTYDNTVTELNVTPRWWKV